MELHEIETHWKNWAQSYHLELRATTKTRTIKELEIAAIYNAIKNTPYFPEIGGDVLEVGCGNGYNCLRLMALLPRFTFTGVDFIAEMVASANELKSQLGDANTLTFLEGNIQHLADVRGLKDQYDITFTDRCLINLNTHELQIAAFEQLIQKTRDGGYVILIENVISTYQRQNELRERLGMQKRTPDKFNLFLDEERFLAFASKHADLVLRRDFASLHDIILYVLIPAINGGKVDYDHPLVAATTSLLLSSPEAFSDSFGDFGQNRLYFFKKKDA
jgi:SAM-dependent methyltransferase